MRTKKRLSIVLATVLLASVVLLAVTPAGAQQTGIPFAGEDNKLAEEELVNAILPYMLDEGDFGLDDVGDAAWVYAHWDGAPKAIKDVNEEVSTFYRPPERIVAAYGHAYMPLQTLYAVDRIVGWRASPGDIRYKILYPAFADIPSVGTGWIIDYEALLKLQPDLVFIRPSVIGGAGGADDHYKKIREIAPDLPVVRLSLYKSYDRTFYVGEMRTLGYLLDKEEEAERFIDYYEGFMDRIKEKTSDIPEEDKPRVYYMSAFTSYYGWKSYTRGDTAMIIAAGGNDIFSDVQGTTISAEEVIRLDPEVIIGQGMYEVGGYAMDDIPKLRDMRDEIMNREELQNVTAVKNGEVYVFPADICCCGASGGRYFLGIVYFAKCLHPDLDLDPTALHQEFLTEFQEGLDYDLSTHGVFVYHPERFPEGR